MAKIRAKKPARSKETPSAKTTKKKDRPALPATAAKAALDRATRDIKRLQKSSSKSAWTIGRRLAQVAELGLHRSRGFASIDQYADKQLGISADRAFLYMRIAQAFSENVAETFGTEKLDRALRYIAATPENEAPSDIPKLKYRVATEAGDGFTEKSFEQVTISDLRAAVLRERAGSADARRRGKKASVPKWLDEEAADAIDKSNRALDKAVGRSIASTADVTARRDGKSVLIDVRGVPLGRANAAFKAIATALK
jgi:hypothetical protein